MGKIRARRPGEFAWRTEQTQRHLMPNLVAALAGDFTLARTLRNPEPLLAIGRVLGSPYRGVALTDLLTQQGYLSAERVDGAVNPGI